MYTLDAGHQHGEAQGLGEPPGRHSTPKVREYTVFAQGPGEPPGRHSIPKVREYIVYTPDAGHQHGEAQGPGGPPVMQSTSEVREYIEYIQMEDTSTEKLRVPESLQVGRVHLRSGNT